jgi:5-methylcytosine-specific restriction endonuclease McrA
MMTPEQRAAQAEYHREWARKAYANGRPRSDATRAKRKERDRQRAEVLAAYGAEYRRLNAEKRRYWESARRARLAQADVRVFTLNDWRRLILRYGGQCAYCHEVRPLTLDHVVPLARGGRHAVGNIVPACGSCNSSKNARLIVEWRTGRAARVAA